MADKKSKKNLDPRIYQIAEYLVKIRKETGHTSYENFSHAKDLPRMQYWKMENGVNFTITSLFRVLDSHGMTISEFFDGLRDIPVNNE